MIDVHCHTLLPCGHPLGRRGMSVWSDLRSQSVHFCHLVAHPVGVVKVFLLHPSSPFGWMSPLCPSPEHLEYGMVHIAEGLFARHMSVIERPTSKNRV